MLQKELILTTTTTKETFQDFPVILTPFVSELPEMYTSISNLSPHSIALSQQSYSLAATESSITSKYLFCPFFLECIFYNVF